MMNEKNTSTVAFRSNLQPVMELSCANDNNFLRHVRDPFALEKLSRNTRYRFSEIQEKEYRSASVHCTYAFPDDYPFGTIRDAEGSEKVVCRCINTSCSLFSKCRPDFDDSELLVLQQNIIFRSDADQFVTAFNLNRKGDAEAAAGIYSQKTVITSEETEEQGPFAAAENESGSIDEETQLETAVSCQTVEKVIQDASFSSFVTVDQDAIICLEPQERTIINAGPGTGKTWTLIEKIKHMLMNGTVDPENILVLCFSKVAVEVIRSRLEQAAERGELLMEWHLVDVRTFDSFSTYLLAWLSENEPGELPANYMLEAQNYEQRVQEVRNVFNRRTDLLAGYSHIIVDEVQDLVGARAEMVFALLSGLPSTCGFTLLGDSCQALYDYLAVNDSGVMSSERFYNSLFHEFPSANYYSLDHNYRQGDEAGGLTASYRTAILSGDNSKKAQEASALDGEVKLTDIRLQRFTIKDAEMFLKAGTLGILTRTNGQALQISSWLRNEGVKHVLHRPMGTSDLAGWIGDVILTTDSLVLNEEYFRGSFSKCYPEAGDKWKKYWNALASTQRDQGKTWYEIDEILKGLINNAKDPLLFENPAGGSSGITVSNIHRAKGREFDSVLLINDVISGLADPDTADDLEHKVCYVALTRPRKRLEKVELPTQYIYISKDENRRCFKEGGFGNRKYLSHFEIGASTDVLPAAFAQNSERQTYIREQLPLDTRLRLLKCPEDECSYVKYRIVPEEDDQYIIGYTTRRFAFEMERALQRIFDNYHRIAYKYFPNIFADVYVDSATTHISAMAKDIPGAREFNGLYIWRGISVSGFAQMQKDRY